MSGRRLGGGRILGSGKGLAPPISAPSSRATSPLAPSEGSLSSSSSPPLSEYAQDLGSNVRLGAPSTASQTNGKLVCPICDEEMLTLLQLNRHIDDSHQELPEAEQDEVKTWFDKQVLKAKRFQPLSLINQKLRGLEVFESNETQPAPSTSTSTPNRASETLNPEELVTRKHWQRATGSDVCTEPACGKRLGPLNGSVNCRKCGRLFCEDHTMYQMKLSRSATHEPVRGVWCRVCETCYKSREGYNDHSPAWRDHTSDFTAMRTVRVERTRLEMQRLEKRLTRLTRMLADAPADAVTGNGNGSSLLPRAPMALAGQRNARKLLEQSVVTWEDDASVSKCPFCHQEFGSWTFRRHHCRICGRVVCADAATGCSGQVGLNVASPTTPLSASEKAPGIPGTPSDQLSLDIRMCRDCTHTIFSHQDFAESIAHKPPDQRAYETLKQFERGIRLLMPGFQKALQALQPPEDDDHGDGDGDGDGPEKPPPTHAQIQEAAKIRRRLTDSFAKYDTAARRIRDIKSSSPAQLRLQKAVYTAATAFLHQNLLPLKHVPAILRSHRSHSSHSPWLNGHRRSLAAPNGPSPLRNGGSEPLSDTASLGATSEASTAMSALETEEKEAREKLIVLEEQRFMVQEMLTNARGARRFEEVGTLTRNLDELDREIERSRKLVRGVEDRWEGLYGEPA